MARHERRPPEQRGVRRFMESFAPIYHLNHQTLTLLIDVARSEIGEVPWAPWKGIGAQLGELDGSALEAIAQSPFLILDSGFNQPSMWRLPDSESGRIQQELAFAPSVIETRLGNLARSTCLLAWHLVRADSIAAQLALGVTASTASTIAILPLTDLQDVSMHQLSSGEVRPRWHDRPETWRRLIVAAKNAQPGDPSPVTSRALQLFLRELVPPRS